MQENQNKDEQAKSNKNENHAENIEAKSTDENTLITKDKKEEVSGENQQADTPVAKKRGRPKKDTSNQ